LRAIVTLVLRHAIITALAGISGGLWSAYALTRYLSSFLYGVSPIDRLTYTSVPLLIAAVAVAASVVPARRAARIDPLIALRSQ
jgi:putative ABC transport system permease protein